MSNVQNYLQYKSPPIGILNCVKFWALEGSFWCNFRRIMHFRESNSN